MNDSIARFDRWLDERRAATLAGAIWLAAFTFAALRILLQLNTMDSYWVYALAGGRWLLRQPLYDPGIDGFQYFPQAALLMVPFYKLGVPAGDVAWRAFSWAIFAHAVWRATPLASTAPRARAFLVVTAVAVPPALGSLFNGQGNLITAALMLDAAVELARDRPWRACAWLAAGLGAKPLMLVMIALACVLRPRALVWRLALALALLALVPFAFAPSDYVMAQYRGWLVKLSLSSQPGRFFEDVRGLLHRAGWDPPHGALRAVRLLAAGATAALVLEIRRRFRDPDASLLLVAASAALLMLFNPRTQPSSYVIVALPAALAVARFLDEGRRRAALTLVVLAACWCGHTKLTGLWLKPLVCVVFVVLLVREIAARPPQRPPAPT